MKSLIEEQIAALSTEGLKSSRDRNKGVAGGYDPSVICPKANNCSGAKNPERFELKCSKNYDGCSGGPD